MILTDIKQKFQEYLKEGYSTEEINSSFNKLSNRLLGTSPVIPTDKVTDEQWDFFEDALLRLRNNEPLEYILGETEFYGRTFKVNSDVHVPRVETETMVTWVMEDYGSLLGDNLNLLDIGTGAGVLPITFARELPNFSIAAIDISEKALNIARENAELINATVEFLQMDIFTKKKLPRDFDIIVSNPPYILKHAQIDVQRKFLEHEPLVSLYIEDNDPMIFNRKIAELAKSSLTKDGAVYIEMNQYLKTESEKIFRDYGFITEFRKDVFGNPRILKAYRN